MDTELANKKGLAVMLLHALGDTIGFNNGEWEFNGGNDNVTIESTNEFFYSFIAKGGVNGIDLSGWYVSDDTMLHLVTAKIMNNYIKNKSLDLSYAKNEFTLMYKRIKQDKSSSKKINRFMGIATAESIDLFARGLDASKTPYNFRSGGNGAAMRNLCIGLVLFGKDKRDKLYEVSTTLSKLTHNSPIGYLAGFTSALFVALGIESIKPEEWPYILVEYLEKKNVVEQMRKLTPDEFYDYITYVRYWKKYTSLRFNENKKAREIKSHINVIARIKFYFEQFVAQDNKEVYSASVGQSGYCCLIMAYDCLLDCKGHWELLVLYSMLHPGDSDTVGAVAAGLYGSVYGFGDVPEKMLSHLEFSSALRSVANQIYLR